MQIHTYRHTTHSDIAHIHAHMRTHTHTHSESERFVAGGWGIHNSYTTVCHRLTSMHSSWEMVIFSVHHKTNDHSCSHPNTPLVFFFFFSWAASNAPECRNNGHKHYPLHPHWVYICCLGNGLVFFLAGSSRRILSPSAILQVNTKQWACETFIFSSGFIFSQSALGSSAFKALVLEQASRAIKRTKINMCCDLKIHGSLIFM